MRVIPVENQRRNVQENMLKADNKFDSFLWRENVFIDRNLCLQIVISNNHFQ